MKGSNDLILNTATMIEAMQFYLDSKMIPRAPKVTDVKAKADGHSTQFTVSLDSDADRASQQEGP